MDAPDISALQNEIVQLRKIISVLLEQIDMLKLNNTRAGNQTGGNNPVSSNPSQESGIIQLYPSNPQKEIGTNELISSTLQKESGMNEFISSDSKKEKGMNESISPTPKKESGMNEPILSPSQKESGTNEVVSSDSLSTIPHNENILPASEKETASKQSVHLALEQTMGANEPVSSLPQTINSSDQNIYMLAAVLEKQIFQRSRDSAREGAARLLIHFYNKGSGRYEELQKLTGYSSGGLGKLMILMRRKGLMQRSAFQQFVPSARALQLMQLAKLKAAGE
ncbi:MAG TPA: hypothetical protein VI757_09285 [Bacteroidia bacterium]|nr:hypothetical protein [Bacteroidia bacterium]